MAKFDDFLEQAAPDLDDFLAGYAAGGGSGSDRRFKIRNIFSQASETIGIGTLTPIGQLEISNAGDSSNWGWPGGGLVITGALDNSSNIYSECVGDSPQTLIEWLWYRTRGNQSTPTALLDANVIGQWQVAGRDETGVSVGDSFALGGNMGCTTVGNWTTTSHGMKYNFQTVRSGSTTLSDTLQLYGGSISVGGASDPGAGGHIGLINGAALIWAGGMSMQATSGSFLAATATAGGAFVIYQGDSGAQGAQLLLEHGSTTPANNDITGQILFRGRDVGVGSPGLVATDYGVINCSAASVTDGSETGSLNFAVLNNGSYLAIAFTAGGFYPTTTVSLGVAANSWTNIFNTGYYTCGAPVTKTGTSGSVGSNDAVIIMNASGTYTLTLPTATSGRLLWIKTIAAQATNSASSNVIPLAGGSAAAAILSANAGRWALLQGNGTNWEIIAGVI